MTKELYAKIDSYLDYAVDLQTRLTAIPAIDPANGGTGEYKKSLLVEEETKLLNPDELIHIDAPQAIAEGGVRPNMAVKFYGKDRSKTLWIMTHLDIVEPGDLSKWTSDPYTLRREGNRIYGRGVEDNQQGLVSSMLVARALREAGVVPPVNLGLLFNADEETGSGFGADYVVKMRPELFGKNDMVLIPDGGMPDGTMIEIAEKSIIWAKFTVTGRQIHAASPDGGINACRAANELAVELDRALHAEFTAQDPLFNPPVSTFEPTKKEANIESINIVPGRDVFYFDCRILPSYDLAAIKAVFKKACDGIAARRGVTVETTYAQELQAPKPTAADGSLVRLLQAAAKEIYRVDAKPMGIGGGTVAAYFRELGYQAAVYSKLDESAHQFNEYCLLDNLLGDAKVMLHCLLNSR
ncbi:MAG: M20 family metallo-hydrolase [Elusimicrobiaceae bacterium]|nr:M20 family metallo-hydrolase [Elusimicrobiaceae bacterium]